MKNLWYLILISLFFIYSCTTTASNNLSNDGKHSFQEFKGKRFFEESGGFSIVIPEFWNATKVQDYNYSVLYGNRENDFTLNIVYDIMPYNETLTKYVDYVIERQNNEYVLTVIERKNFVTQNNLIGERVIINLFLHGRCIRQVHYFLPRKDNIKIHVVCSVASESGDAYDTMFNEILKTFEWTDYSSRKFFEESLGISLIPPESWQPIKIPGYQYTVLTGQEINGFTSYIAFDLVKFNDELNIANDLLIETLKNQHSDNFMLIQRGDFTVKNSLKGEKIIFTISQPGQITLRQVVYRFNRKETILSVICIVSSEAGDTYDEIFDKMMDTFEWIER